MRTRLVFLVLIIAALNIAARDAGRGSAGEGFSYRSVSFKESGVGSYVDVIGEMENRSGTDYRTVYFDLTLYDARNNVLAVDKIDIRNFNNNSKRPMKTSLQVDIKKISGYKIDYSFGTKK